MNKSDRDELVKFLARQPPDEPMVSKLGRFLAFQEAISLAIEERTGQPAPDECDYTEADFDRAEEIMLLYPRS